MNKRYTELGSYENIEFTHYYNLLDSMLDCLPVTDYECYYVYNHGWDVSPDNTNEFRVIHDLTKIKYTKKIVIWVTHDSLRGVKEHDPQVDTQLQGLKTLEGICKLYPDKHFILLTPHSYLRTIINSKNLHAIELPPYPLMRDQKKYYYHHCVDKSDLLKYQWITLAHSPSWHRTLLLAYLLFLKLDLTGASVISSKILDRISEFSRLEEYLPYKMSPLHWHCSEHGFQQLKSNTLTNRLTLPPATDLYISNYNKTLLPLYKQVGVEIVTSSTFSEPVPYITEKELQSMYGYNFLIFISPTKTVAWLRDKGFDLFDDVVDHSYDLIKNPADRIFRAIEKNIHLLNGSANLRKLLVGNKQRFINNCRQADLLCSTLPKTSLSHFTSVIKEINGQYYKI
jgi:hypothetical protein